MSNMTPPLFQVILMVAGVAALAAGAVLLGRELQLPGFRPAAPLTGRLEYWSLNGMEFTLLILFILFTGALLQIAALTVWGEAIKAASERAGLEVAVFGFALHAGGILAWPIFSQVRRALFLNYQTTPPPELPRTNARLGWLAVFRASGTAFLLTLPLVLLVSWGWSELLHLLGLPAEPQDAIQIFRNTRTPLILFGMHLVACVIAPINEELLFRRGLFHFLRQRMSHTLAVVLSALCFGAVHSNLASFLPLSVLGVILAREYERSGDVRVPIITHALFNLNTLLFLQAGLSD